MASTDQPAKVSYAQASQAKPVAPKITATPTASVSQRNNNSKQQKKQTNVAAIKAPKVVAPPATSVAWNSIAAKNIEAPVIMPPPNSSKQQFSNNGIQFRTPSDPVLTQQKLTTIDVNAAGTEVPAKRPPASSGSNPHFGSFQDQISAVSNAEVTPEPTDIFSLAVSESSTTTTSYRPRPPNASGVYKKNAYNNYNNQQQHQQYYSQQQYYPQYSGYQQQQSYPAATDYSNPPAFMPSNYYGAPYGMPIRPQTGTPAVCFSSLTSKKRYPVPPSANSAATPGSSLSVPIVISKPSPSKAIKIVNPKTLQEVVVAPAVAKIAAVAPSALSINGSKQLDTSTPTTIPNDYTILKQDIPSNAKPATKSESSTAVPLSKSDGPVSTPAIESKPKITLRNPKNNEILDYGKNSKVGVPTVAKDPQHIKPTSSSTVTAAQKVASKTPIPDRSSELVGANKKSSHMEEVFKALLRDKEDMDKKTLIPKPPKANKDILSDVIISSPAKSATAIPIILEQPKRAQSPKRDSPPKESQVREPSPKRAKSPEKYEEPIPAVSVGPKALAISTPAHEVLTDVEILESSENLKYPKNIQNPNISPNGPKKYTYDFLIAMRNLVSYIPFGMVSVGELINDASSPRPEKRHSVDRTVSGRGMQRQMSSGPSRYDKGGYSDRGKSAGSTMSHSLSQGGKRGGRSGGADGGGWVEAGPRRGSQRGPPPLPEPAFEPLSVSENAWKPKRTGGGKATVVAGSDEASVRLTEVGHLLTSTLNKLAPEKFEALSEKILNLGITNEEILVLVIDKIFDKALMEQHYGSMYARLCRMLSDELPLIQKWVGLDQKNNSFRRFLLNKCQREFEAGKTWAVEEAQAREIAKVGAENMTAEERADFLDKGEKRVKSKIRSLGNVRFVGELFLLSMLSEKTMHNCLVNMLQNLIDPEEEAVESMCKLLKTIGATLERDKAKNHMDTYFMRIRELSMNLKLTSRIRFMLLDLIDLRSEGWKDKNAPAGPKTLSEIRKGMDKKDEQPQHQNQRSSSSRGGAGSGGSYRREMPSLRDQFHGDRNSDRGNRGRSSQDSRTVTSSGVDGWSTVAHSTPRTPSDESEKRGWNVPKMDRQSSTSSRGGSRPASPSVVNAPQVPKEKKKANMFEILDKSEGDASSPNSDVQNLAPKLTLKQREERVPNAIREWFTIFDIEEINTSLKEIGPDMKPAFVSQLLTASCEKKRDTISKALVLLKDLLGNEHISVDDTKKGISLFLNSCMDEDLFSEFPLATYVIGSYLGDLVHEETVPLSEVDEMIGAVDGMKDGRITDAAKIFAFLLNRLKDHIGDDGTVSLLGDFDLNSLWGAEKPDVESYTMWVEKNDLYFLSITQEDNEAEPDVSDILADGLGNTPIEDLISEIQRSISGSSIKSPEFISAVTHSLVSYMTSQTIHANGRSSPIAPTREMFLLHETMMKDFGFQLLSKFIDEEASRKLRVLTAIKDFYVDAGYPKKLLEDLFRLLYNNDLVEDSVYTDWRDTCLKDSKLKRELVGFYKWLENDDQEDQ